MLGQLRLTIAVVYNDVIRYLSWQPFVAWQLSDSTRTCMTGFVLCGFVKAYSRQSRSGEPCVRGFRRRAFSKERLPVAQQRGGEPKPSTWVEQVGDLASVYGRHVS